MSSLELILITGRRISQGRSLDIGKLTDDYFKSVALAELDSDDFEKLGLKDGDNVEVTSEYGSVVVKAVKSRKRHPGIIFIPMGPWANQLVNPDTYGSGMPTFKGIPVRVAKTEKKVLDIWELFEKKFNVKLYAVNLDLETPAPGDSVKVVKDVVCSFCGCLCDDLEVEISGSKIVKVRKACALGTSKILHYDKNRILHPYIRVNGKLEKTSLEAAIKKAAKILVDSKYPLLYGWSNTTVEAIRLGAELAEYLGGVFDNTSVVCHGPTVLGVQEAGFVTATLGQIRNHADLIIYWGCNPLHAHPRHANRYSALARGIFVKSRKERKIVVIDVKETDTVKLADLFIKVEPGRDYELISAIRALIKGYDVEFDEVAGVDIETIRKLVDMMISARFGVIFYGLGLTMSIGKGRNIEEVIRLAQDLNEWTKFVALPMRGHYNVVGANQVSAWITGYAFAVDFRRKYPRHNPGVTSATDLLEEGDVDAALIVASDPVAHFPAKAVENLLKIPVITLDPKWNLTAAISTVIIPVAIAGVEVEGTAYRMDKVPLRLKKLVEPPSGVLSDEEVLKLLLEEVKKLA